MSDIKRVGVVGAGQMGAGIAEMCARSGLEVMVVEVSPAAAAAGQERVAKSLDRAVRGGKISEAERAAAWLRLSYAVEFDALRDSDLVVEAAAESEDVKADIFRRLDRAVARPDAVLASNTSSIPIISLAMATSRPEQVIGVHFFNPVPVLPLVELIPSLRSSAQTRDQAERFASQALGKQVIWAADRAGFVVNALLIPYLLSAVRMLEGGFATAADIDSGMVLGCAHPMGPLRLADMIGLDTVTAIADSLYAEFREQSCAAPPLLRRMVGAGMLGRKSGQGFYPYAPGSGARAR